MKEFLSDLFYMCSADNETSRVTYIMIVAFLIIAIIGFVAGIVAFIATKNILSLILALVLAVGFVGIIIWLKKS